jgi:hypothetical protein
MPLIWCRLPWWLIFSSTVTSRNVLSTDACQRLLRNSQHTYGNYMFDQRYSMIQPQSG